LNGESIQGHAWANLLQFEKSPLECLPIAVRSRLGDAFKLNGISFRVNGETLPAYGKGPSYIDPTTGHNYNHGVDDGESKEMHPFSIADTAHWPLAALPTEVLLSILASRGVPSVRDETHLTLVEAVHECYDKPVVPPSREIPQISKWQVYEVLQPAEDQQWRDDHWWELLVGTDAKIDPITPEQLAPSFWHGNENIQARVQRLVEGGNFDLSSLQYLHCISATDGTPKLLVKCLCLPSIKSENKSNAKKALPAESEAGTTIVQPPNPLDDDDDNDNGYLVYLCFEQQDGEQRVVLPWPYSCCDCPNGRSGCSHGHAFKHVIQNIQKMMTEFPWLTQGIYMDAMPESPRLTQRQPMLLELTAVMELVCRRKGRRSASCAKKAKLN
jgi:hypothetical protein